MDGFEVGHLARVTTTVVDGIVVTLAAGEVDMSSVDIIRAEVSRQLDRHPASLVLDLSALTFFGSAGLDMLIEQQRHAQELGATFVVVADGDVVLKPLEITGLAEVLAVCPSVPEAVRLLQDHPVSE